MDEAGTFRVIVSLQYPLIKRKTCDAGCVHHLCRSIPVNLLLIDHCCTILFIEGHIELFDSPYGIQMYSCPICICEVLNTFTISILGTRAFRRCRPACKSMPGLIITVDCKV